MEVDAGGGLSLLFGGVCFLGTILLAVLSFAAIIWAIVDIVRNERLSSNEQLIWVIVVLLLQLIGVLIYVFVGRKGNSHRGD